MDDDSHLSDFCIFENPTLTHGKYSGNSRRHSCPQEPTDASTHAPQLSRRRRAARPQLRRRTQLVQHDAPTSGSRTHTQIEAA